VLSVEGVNIHRDTVKVWADHYISLHLKMESTGCPETSVRIYHYMLGNNQEEQQISFQPLLQFLVEDTLLVSLDRLCEKVSRVSCTELAVSLWDLYRMMVG
jgi:hypothetical protein